MTDIVSDVVVFVVGVDYHKPSSRLACDLFTCKYASRVVAKIGST